MPVSLFFCSDLGSLSLPSCPAAATEVNVPVSVQQQPGRRLEPPTTHTTHSKGRWEFKNWWRSILFPFTPLTTTTTTLRILNPNRITRSMDDHAPNWLCLLLGIGQPIIFLNVSFLRQKYEWSFVFVYSNFCHFLFLDRRSCYACRKRCQCIPSPFRPTAISYELRLITFQSTRSAAKGRTNNAPCASSCSVVLGWGPGLEFKNVVNQCMKIVSICGIKTNLLKIYFV